MKMPTAFLFTVFGYFSGSILFARVYGSLFGKDLISNSSDGNPGTSNAFMYGGMLCGTLTLFGDLLKGFLPVFLYLYITHGNTDIYLASVLAAPVFGHIFPCFYRFRGGKGIAVSFGCLLGLLPIAKPLLALAAVYIILSVAVRISPHYYRTIVAYCIFAAITARFAISAGVTVGCLLISVFIILCHLKSREEKQKFSVSLPAFRHIAGK